MTLLSLRLIAMERLALQEDGGDAEVRALVPLGRQGTLANVGKLALFLGSDAAIYISGTVIACDGGTQSTLAPLISGAVTQLRSGL